MASLDSLNSWMADYNVKKKAEDEANARARTFDLGKILPAAITSIATMNPTPLLLAASGEGVRAATGSDTNLADMATKLGSEYLPKQVASNDSIKVRGDYTSASLAPDYASRLGKGLDNAQTGAARAAHLGRSFQGSGVEQIYSRPDYIQGLMSKFGTMPQSKTEILSDAKTALESAKTLADIGETKAKTGYYSSLGVKAQKYKPTTKTPRQIFTEDDIPDDLKDQYGIIGGKIVKKKTRSI